MNGPEGVPGLEQPPEVHLQLTKAAGLSKDGGRPLGLGPILTAVGNVWGMSTPPGNALEETSKL